MAALSGDRLRSECGRQAASVQIRAGRAQQHHSASRSRQTLASPSRVRWSSAVDDAVELVCTGLTHKARALINPLWPQGGLRHGRWCRVRAPSSGRRSGPSELFQPYVTQMCILLMQRASCRRLECSKTSPKIRFWLVFCVVLPISVTQPVKSFIKNNTNPL